MPDLGRIANAHYRTAQRISRAAAAVVKREFRKVDERELDRTYYEQAMPQMFAAVEMGQRAAASLAERYVQEVTGLDGDGEIVPAAFSGLAADGRDLVTLMQQPLIATKTAIRRGHSPAQALAVGSNTAGLIAHTEVTDAGRVADGVAVAARPSVDGYVRLLTPPSCARCAVLAGRFYRWSEGFERHPQCDCRHVPVSDARLADPLTTDPEAAVRAGQVHGLSKADRQAIEDGADVGQVINARRGMYEAGGKKYTKEGMSRRGFAFQYRGQKPRMRPESIYQDAGSRAEAISMLRDNGYIV